MEESVTLWAYIACINGIFSFNGMPPGVVSSPFTIFRKQEDTNCGGLLCFVANSWWNIIVLYGLTAKVN